MENMLTKKESVFSKIKTRTSNFVNTFKSMKKLGAINVLEIIVLAIIVIAVAWVFRDVLTDIVNIMGEKIRNSINDLFS